MIHLEGSDRWDNALHNEIMREIKKIGPKIPTRILSSGGKLLKLEIDDNFLNATEKSQLNTYVSSLVTLEKLNYKS
jgi:hypothetical protein